MPQGDNPNGTVNPGVFDLQKSLENLDGDRDLFRSMVAVFLEELPLWMAKIEKGYEAGDCHAIESAAHSIKGTAGNFGASHTTETARLLETLGRNKKLDEMEPVIVALREAVAILSAALQQAADAF